MKKWRFAWYIVALLLVFVFILPFASEANTKPATGKEATVEVKLTPVKKTASGKATTLGTLKKNQKIMVYAQTKGWAEIKYKNKKAYISIQSIRFYKNISLANVKKITERVTSIQKKVKDQPLTLKEIHSIMDQGFTKEFINNYVKYNLDPKGKDKKGSIIYVPKESDSSDYYIEPFDWYLKYAKEEPTASYYSKNGKEYLKVSQYNPVDELYLPHWNNLYLIKEPKSDWKVYRILFNQ